MQGPIDRDRIARAAVDAAVSVPGVLRLQPNLKHLVGRKARDLFAGLAASGATSPADAEPTGIDIDRGPGGVEVTVRIVTGISPPPHLVALGVRRAVVDTLAGAGLSAQVSVVVVDVET